MVCPGLFSKMFPIRSLVSPNIISKLKSWWLFFRGQLFLLLEKKLKLSIFHSFFIYLCNKKKVIENLFFILGLDYMLLVFATEHLRNFTHFHF